MDVPSMTVRVTTEPLGGGALTRLALSGGAPPTWYPRVPASAEEWRTRARHVADEAPRDWLDVLAPAFQSAGPARDRLTRVARGGGVVVTTGQQPGLFGGPVYTWSKALSALALADAIEAATGVPAAPVFWAATDDADFAEASLTWIASVGGAELLQMDGVGIEGRAMAETPLGDVRALFDSLAQSAGSAVDPLVLDVARRAYGADATVGDAYVVLLRALLHPLGISVIDASHAALLDAEQDLLLRALSKGEEISRALADRSHELRQAGFEPQVADVDGLSLVFARRDGAKVRVPLEDAAGIAASTERVALSPNVLLRPVVERAVLPTVAYVAGPGELAYFAQVSAVASALGVAAPLGVPRWSCTILEPHVQALLDRLGVSREELADAHAVEGRLAKRAVPASLLDAVEAMRRGVEDGASRLRAEVAGHDAMIDARVIDGVARQMTWRVDHVERRLVRAAKRREASLMRDIATVRGALYPGGKRQERALNFLPMLARQGPHLLEEMIAGARIHAEGLVRRGDATAPRA